MTIYDRPTKELMRDWATEHLQPGKFFEKSQPVNWFKEHYPAIKSNTVEMHVEGMSVNNPIRRHHPNIKPGSGHDLFYKQGAGRFRLWDREADTPPRYKADIEADQLGGQLSIPESEAEAAEEAFGETAFAFERDLQNYLVRNLQLLETGLKLYEEEGLNGIEFNAGGRYIDILAVGADGALVVIELKVSRGYDRVIGQLLRYMGWVEQNLGSPKPVRGIIVANEISRDLILATNRIPGVKLVEYEISFKLRAIDMSPNSRA